MEQQCIQVGDRVMGADELAASMGRFVPDYVIHRYYGSRDEYLAEFAAHLNAQCDELLGCPEERKEGLRRAIAQRCADLLVNGIAPEIAHAAIAAATAR